eukprot:522791-Pyramimonas_sp.AAC.1
MRRSPATFSADCHQRDRRHAGRHRRGPPARHRPTPFQCSSELPFRPKTAFPSRGKLSGSTDYWAGSRPAVYGAAALDKHRLNCST